MRCSMVWDLFRTKKEKPAAGKTGYWRTFWRKRWDSNPRTLADQLISSQSRYDHFDTLPYLSQHQHLRKRGELMGRTSKNIKFRIPEKTRKIKGFRNGGFPIATTISSADPSTTWVHLHINFAFIEYLVPRHLSRENKAHGGVQASPGSGGNALFAFLGGFFVVCPCKKKENSA